MQIEKRVWQCIFIMQIDDLTVTVFIYCILYTVTVAILKNIQIDDQPHVTRPAADEDFQKSELAAYVANNSNHASQTI